MSTAVVRQHSELGASKADRWMNCGGSVRLTRGLPDPETDYQREGTAAHWLAEMLLLGTRHPADVAENGYEITDEMREDVQVYVNEVRRQIAEEEGSLCFLEKKFSLGSLNPPAPMFGTSDAIVVQPRARRLYINDLKFGRGVLVEVRDNPQLLYYALGALLELEKDACWRGAFDTVVITIVQPRAYHKDGAVRSAEYSYADVIDFAMRLLELARAATAPDAPLNPGPWCKFCPAAGSCTALADRAYAVAEVEFDTMAVDQPPKPELLPAAVFADMLAHLHILEDWATTMRREAHARLMRGEELPGWKLVAGRPGNRKWVDEKAVRDWCRRVDLRDDEIHEPPTLKGPAGIERAMKQSKLKVKLPDELTTRHKGQPQLARADDPRPPLALSPDSDFHVEALPPAGATD